jgi:hypothetical protein
MNWTYNLEDKSGGASWLGSFYSSKKVQKWLILLYIGNLSSLE